MIRNKQKFLTIKQFAELCDSTPRTIRFYHQKGLLSPTKIDQQTGYRYYLPEQAKNFSHLKLLQSFNLPLNQMKKGSHAISIQKLLKNQLKSIRLDIENRNKKYIFLKKIHDFIYTSESPKSLTKTEFLESFKIFGTIKSNISYSQIPLEVTELKTLAKKLKVQTTDDIIVRYHEPNAYKPLGSKLEIGIKYTGEITTINLPPGYFFKTFPQQKALTYLYRGPRNYLTFIHQKLLYSNYFQKFIYSDIPFDWEINKVTTSEYDQLTKIVYPIK